MRNTWLIIKREYLERVRTTSFLIITLFLPAIVTGVMLVPAKLATAGRKIQHIVVVTSTREFGDTVRQSLLSASAANDDNDDESGPEAKRATKSSDEQYIIDVDSNSSEGERAVLRERVASQAIDSYLWLTDDAIATGKVTWASRSIAAPAEESRLEEQLTRCIQYSRLSKNGYSGDQVHLLLKPIKLDVIRIEHGQDTKDSSGTKVVEVVIMVMLLNMAVLLYGVSVMRSVLEEKSSRVIEVLLSSATSRDLMIGKLCGVGAVGLTQIVVWVLMAGALALPGLALQTDLNQLRVSPGVLVAFAVFFLLGYLLFSAMYAAIGAITTSEQEGQQLQILIVIPLFLALLMLNTVVQTPSAPSVVWLSMVPFLAPVLMYARIVVQTPPAWQIALSLFLLIATVGGLLVLCARIYRVGILMYGKAPTLPELLIWLKYAKS
jgi:ABC-2 type transport system permease protein